MMSVYYSALEIAQSQWKVQRWEESTEALRAIFDMKSAELFPSMAVLLLNVFGSLSLSFISEMALNIIVGTNLIGRRLFLLEKQLPQGQNLSTDQIRAEIQLFAKSEDRKRMRTAIAAAKMSKIDFEKSNRVDRVMEVAERAIQAAVGTIDESLFVAERRRMLGQSGTYQGS